MRCPLCPDSVLVASHRHGIEVDHCPTCRGVWLDRGELDHLVDSVARRLGPTAPEPAGTPPLATSPGTPGSVPGQRGYDDDRRRDQRPGGERYERDRRRKKRKHSVLDLLEEVLDL